MLGKITKKITKQVVENAKETVKEEVSKSADDILPTVVGLATLGIFLFINMPSQKLTTSTITINNYYFGR